MQTNKSNNYRYITVMCLLLALVIGNTVAGSQQNDAKRVQITGRFVQESGEPIPNVMTSIQFRVYREHPDRASHPDAPPEWFDDYEWVGNYNALGDSDGNFIVVANKEHQAVVLARHKDFVPNTFLAKEHDDERSEISLGDVVLNNGFQPTIQVLDKEGKPVNDVWVSLNRVVRGWEQRFNYYPERMENALTDADGKAILGPVETGHFFVNIVERPWGWRRSEQPNNAAEIERYFENEALAKPIKGVYLTAALALSPESPTATIQADESVNVTVNFTGATPKREPDVMVQGGSVRFTDPGAPQSSTVPIYRSKFLGEGKFLIEVPVRLPDATLLVNTRLIPGEFNNELFYQCFIDDKRIEPTQGRGTSAQFTFPLGTLDGNKEVRLVGTKSPIITIHAVDEEGKPMEGYFAGAQYTRRDTIPWVTWDDENVRIARGNHSHLIRWPQIATNNFVITNHRSSSLDVEFGWRNFGEETTKINAVAISPDEELRLYVVARGYDVAIQTLPKLAEGEERELTVTLKAHKEPGTVSP